ncbi:uncharacterized protein LOC143356206 [Halictus rubicundus]|uniref:uncharacterized protein LOC143356206 n=1 Tax=Halictus rubicundus TaxID=77578 RepID=UPI004035E3A2
MATTTPRHLAASRVCVSKHLKKMNAKAVLILLVCGCVANGQFLEDEYGQGARRALIERLGRLSDGPVADSPRSFDLNLDNFGLLRGYAFRDDDKNRRNAAGNEDTAETWKGRWMPDKPGEPAPPPKIFPNSEQTSLGLEPIHGVPMGNPSPNCDDAKTNLTMDWNGSPADYTCYQPKFIPNKNVYPTEYCERIPRNYVALHKCMREKIEYDDEVPLFGPHRPLWPVYGEYKFLPKQRWLHSLEHGAIVALYHPCANPLEVQRLKSLVSGCLRRHVITPYNMLPSERPLALVAWGCRLNMAYTNPEAITTFILKHALRGPEDIPRDGDFDEGLVQTAETVSDLKDTNLCPNDSNA